MSNRFEPSAEPPDLDPGELQQFRAEFVRHTNTPRSPLWRLVALRMTGMIALAGGLLWLALPWLDPVKLAVGILLVSLAGGLLTPRLVGARVHTEWLAFLAARRRGR